LRSGDVAKTIAKALAQLGKIEFPGEVLSPWTEDDINKYFGGVSSSSATRVSKETNHHRQNKMVATNVHAVASRARALGWKPKYTAEDCHATILPEVEYMLGRDSVHGQ
jgi:nucleoside-diphosphate-sugar epimerase